MRNVGNAHGVIDSFVKVCNMDEDASRLDLLLAILRLYFERRPLERQRFMQAISHAGVHSKTWTDPIINPETMLVAGEVFSWAVRPREQERQANNLVVYSGLQVAMATDVLFLIVAQAMYAAEWKRSPVDNQIVVHTRNMANAAQELVFLMLHTFIPMAYVPAHNGVVVLSEPSHKREHRNRPVMVPYRRYLHVNHCDGQHSFLDTNNRILENDKDAFYAKITTTHGVELAIHTKHIKANSLSNNCKKPELFTYPPESMAHILPYVEHFRDACVAHA
jgi:hypothetical protein